MARIAFFVGALVALGRWAEAIPLPEGMEKALSKIAADRSLSEPIDGRQHGLDRMRKQVLIQCQNETDSFHEWLQSTQDDLSNNTHQIKKLQGHEREVEAMIFQLNGTHSTVDQKRSDDRKELEKAKKTLKKHNGGLNKTEIEKHISKLESEIHLFDWYLSAIQNETNNAVDDLTHTQKKIKKVQGFIDFYVDLIQNGTHSHKISEDQCRSDLDILAEISQYIVYHTDGYYPLITEVTPAKEAQRIDLGIVPQTAFSISDFTYLLKYQQLRNNSESKSSNLFNVVNIADGAPLTNQAGVFLSDENMFWVEISDGTKAWPGNFWIRIFYRDPIQFGEWNAIALAVSSSNKTVTFVHRDNRGHVKTELWTGFHGNLQVFNETAIYATSRDFHPLDANFDDFRRYDRALNLTEIDAVFTEYFP